jgi:beta-1,2-mannobiose phosphorylase / 1,2-beta-oligomannan phosphorylase
MLQIKRYLKNPIITPDPNNHWEAFATFNGSVIKEKGVFHILFRAMSNIQDYHDHHSIQISSIGHATSPDGFQFGKHSQFIFPEYEWERFGCEDPRITKFEGRFYTFYTALSTYPPQASGIKIAVAISDDLETIKEKHIVTPFNAKAMALFPERINGKITVLFTVNTDMPPAHIVFAQFDKIEELWSDTYWRDWYRHLNDYRIHLKRMKTDQVEVGVVPIKTKYGWLFPFSYIQNYTTPKPEFTVEIIMLDLYNPQRIVGKIHEPILKPEEPYELDGHIRNIVFPTGAVIEKKQLLLYYGAADTTCCVASIDYNDLLEQIELTKAETPKLNRYEGNPIMEPKNWHSWEEKAVFNPAILRENNKTYILYRGLSNDDVSTIGCAISDDGYHIDERLRDPVYVPREEFEKKHNPSGGSGCEDPRLTRIENKIYMLYTAYNGVDNPRVAITSIQYDDFLNRKWIWKTPILISPPGIDDKDACLLPEKINGKYAIFHRIDPDIVIDYVDSLDFKNNQWLQIKSVITPRKGMWDSRKIGISSVPIKTKYGWVLLYHGISAADNEYRTGAMLLDLKDPGIVLARTEFPLIEPETQYEKFGVVNNVVFPCGSCLIDDNLFVYYGGADKVIGVATMNFSILTQYLKDGSIIRYLAKTFKFFNKNSL